MPRIIVSVSNDLVTDQRIFKVCQTLYANGYELLLIGRKGKLNSVLTRPYKTRRMRLLFNKGPLFYAELNLRLFFVLLFSSADVFLANDLDTLLANYTAARLKGVKLVYDTHEYFTEVPELEGRLARKIWLKIEASIFPKLKNVYTVGPALAKVYSEKYKVDVQIIRNVPVKQEVHQVKKKHYLLYQGALNEGRGIVELLNAIKSTNYHLKIAGTGDLEQEIKAYVSSQKLDTQVELLGRLEPKELKEITAQAFLGFNLLEKKSLNYYYSLANKFFDYIQAEVPVISMDFPEYRAIFSEYNLGVLIGDLEKESIINAIELVEREYSNYQKEVQKAKEIFIWENEEERLRSIFANLV